MSSESNQAAIEKQQDGGKSQYSSLPKHKISGAPLLLYLQVDSPESLLLCLAQLHVPLHHLQHVLRLIVRQSCQIKLSTHG